MKDKTGMMNRKFERLIGIYNARQENEYYLPITHKQNKMEALKETTVYVPILMEDLTGEDWTAYRLDMDKRWLREQSLYCFTKEELSQLLTHLFEMGQDSCMKKENYIKNLLP